MVLNRSQVIGRSLNKTLKGIEGFWFFLFFKVSDLFLILLLNE